MVEIRYGSKDWKCHQKQIKSKLLLSSIALNEVHRPTTVEYYIEHFDFFE